MRNLRERAHDIAEEGLDRILEGDEKAGWRMIEEAKELDPGVFEELIEEIERDLEIVKRFVENKLSVLSKSGAGEPEPAEYRPPTGVSSRWQDSRPSHRKRRAGLGSSHLRRVK